MKSRSMYGESFTTSGSLETRAQMASVGILWPGSTGLKKPVAYEGGLSRISLGFPADELTVGTISI